MARKKAKDQQPSESGNSIEGQRASDSVTPRPMIVFPTTVSEIPTDIISLTFGNNIKLPEGYFDSKGMRRDKKTDDKISGKATMKDPYLKDTVITSDFERNTAEASEKSWHKKRKERKSLREATAGKDWYNIKPPEMTQEVERDLKILQMRNILDPKRFYKHNDRQAIPKYFQIGRVMDNAADFYSSRIPKKQRKRHLAEELLEDAQFQQYQKRKYNELAVQKKQQFKKRLGKRKKKIPKH